MTEFQSPRTHFHFLHLLMMKSPFRLCVPFPSSEIPNFSNHDLPIYSIHPAFAISFCHDLGAGLFGGVQVPDQQGRNETHGNEKRRENKGILK